MAKKKQNVIEEDGAVDVSETVSPQESADPEYAELVRKNTGDHKKALFEYCYLKNIFFSEKVVSMLLRHMSDDDYGKMPGLYIDTINADYRYKDLKFFDQLHMENFEKIYSEELKLLSLIEDDKRNRQQIINIIGYDPFEENPDEDRPQLYRDLTGMLTEAMRKDVPRSKAAVEVVLGYSNIKKYQTRANALINSGQLDDATQKQLDRLLEMVSKIQKSVLDISEKNGFSNSRTLGSNGRGTLSDVLMTVDEHMYDEGIANYYDIETSKSIAEITDVSMKSILNQIKLTGQEWCEMLAQQSEDLRKAQMKAKKAVEALRLAKSMIKKEELINQLEEIYRKKGINEEDIQEFVSREYKMTNI